MKILYKILFLLFNFNLLANNFFPDSLIRFSDIGYYSWTETCGVGLTTDNLKSWETISEGLPKKIVYPWKNDEYKAITYLHIDNLDIKRLAATTSFGLFLFDSEQKKWKEITLTPPVKSSNYVTSVALSSINKNKILLGTSFNGLFESLDGGKTWNRFFKNSGFRKNFLMGADFFEEISAIAYNPEDDNIIYVAKGFSNGLFKTNSDKTVWEKIELPFLAPIINLRFLPNLKESPILEVYTKTRIYKYSILTGEWLENSQLLPKIDKSLTVAKAQRVATASGRTGLYIRSDKATGKNFQNHLKMIEDKGMNSFVLDMKDDNGFITYNTDLEYPKSIKAVSVRFNLDDVIKEAHNKNIYVIGRIVTFKDPRLFKAEKNRWTILDKYTKQPWGAKFIQKDKNGNNIWIQKEHWVDPYNEEIWDYNISIAEELEKRGIDEIQFDYIRFPTDGPVDRCFYRNKKDGMGNIDALESFLRKAREKIIIPISTDLYGYNCYYRMGNWMGQDINMFSKYVDAISPMFYPSHFPRSFVYEKDYIAWSKKIYNDGSNRAVSIVSGNAVIRPYVQAFIMGGESYMDEKTYKEYLLKQLEGTVESGASGWTLWNNSNIYYMVDKSLENFGYRK